MKRIAVLLALAIVCALPASAQRRAPARGKSSKPAATPPKKAAPARTERPVPFRVGETLTYDLSWSSYLTAGTVVATVKEKKASYNSTAYYIVAEGRPTPLVAKIYSLYYKADTLLDSFSLMPQRGSIYSEEGRRHRYRTTRFDRAAQRASFEYETDHVMKIDFPTSPVAQDALSALYVMRAIPLRANDRMTMPVSDNGLNYKVQLDIGSVDRVKVPFGEISAWKVVPTILNAQGKTQGRNLTLWISDDARRLPVRIEGEMPVGRFVAALRDAR